MNTTLAVLLVGLLLPVVARGEGAVLGPVEMMLDGCKEQPTRPGERKLQCPNYRASVSVEQPAFSAEALIDAVMSAVPKDAKHETSRVQITIGGEKRSGLRYTDASSKPLMRGVVAIVPSQAADKVRLVGCEETQTRACDLVLEALARQVKGGKGPPAAGVDARAPSVPASEPTLAGRRIETPAGCSYAPDGPKSMFRCSSATASWVEAAADDPEGMDWIYQPLKKALATQGRLTEKLRPCRFDGAKSECRVLEVVMPNGRTIHSIALMTSLRGHRMWAQCNVSGPATDALPPPCAALFRFE